MTCSACRAGPFGIDGHSGIVFDRKAGTDANPVFVCANCAQRYSRHYEGAGVFVWVKTAPPPQERLEGG